MNPSITVVVMGYRNGGTIVDAVRSVHGQRRPNDSIVVVTSGPDSGVDDVRREFADVTVIAVEPRLTPGATRNRGIEAASGDVIAFLAGDCVARPGFLDAHRSGHGRGFRAVSGSVANYGANRAPAVASWLLSYRTRLPGLPAEVIGSASPRRHGLSVDRSLFSLVGLYDPGVERGEDSRFADRLEQAGCPVWFEPAACVEHRGPATTRALLADERRRANGSDVVRTGRGPTRWIADGVKALTISASAMRRGWRFGGIPRRHVAKATPWIVAGAIARVTGYRSTVSPRASTTTITEGGDR